ncbi:non-specific serine/threonine protein kinase [Balamuthia mandrillaris]
MEETSSTASGGGVPALPAQTVLISQGAEARVYETRFFGKRAIVKERFSKQYRHPTLDKKLNESRITQEARCLMKSKKAGVAVPALYFVDTNALRIYMEYVEGQTVKHWLFAHPEETDNQQLAEAIGQSVARLHSLGVVHGDLTTSNMVLADDFKLVLIDFGLSYVSRNPEEDQAVDLYVLERAFLSTHPNSETLFEGVLRAYKRTAKNGNGVISRLTIVRQRGRKKLAFG